VKQSAHLPMLLALAAFMPAVAAEPPTVAPGDPSAALQSQQRFCEAEGGKLQQALDKLNAGKDELIARLAKAQAEADAKKQPAPEAPRATPALDVKMVETLQQAAQTHQAAAAQALAQASRATDPTMQRYYLKEATHRLESVRNAVTRAESILATVDPQRQPAPTAVPPTPRLKEEGLAMKQLRAIEKGQGDNQGYDGPAALSSFAPAAGERPIGTSIYANTPVPTQFDRDKGTLKLSDGRTIDVAPLQRAVAAVRPAAARQPLFVPDPAAGGALRPSPAVRELMANPEDHDRLKQVGGVALDVTFESLDFARVADFRGLGSRALVERPLLLSLTQLYARLAPYATPERWGSLPEALRHPGGAARIYGFVLDGEHQDVFVLASASADPDERLDVDTLVLALRSVWSEGQVPAVSLDPLPDDPAGPQYPRVLSVPPDSVVARIMLDADYAMKRIMLGTLDPGVDDYVSALDLAAESGAVETSRDRFWFHPVPLGMNSLRASPSGRTWLFGAGLQVLTENQRLRDGALTDSGESNDIAAAAAREFTAHLDRFETAPAITPRRIFVRLHGVLDAVAVARLWRELRIGYPVLSAFARLPYRQLTSAEERVPAFYPGVYATREMEEGTLYAAGGVQLRLRPRAGAVDRYADPVASALETAVEKFPVDRFAQPLAFAVSLARPAAYDAGAARAELREGKGALASGDYVEAGERFRAAAASDPLDVDAWTQLALAESLAGNAQRAREALARAFELEPADPAVRVMAFEIERSADPARALAGLDQSARRDLGQDYVAAAYAALHAADREQAMRLSTAALELSSNNAEALLVRFFARPESDTSARRRDVVRAIRAYREQIAHGEAGGVQRRLAFALTLSATQRTSRATSGLLAALAAPEKPFDTYGAITDLESAAAEAREARELDPELPLAPAVEAMARGMRVPLLRAEGVQAESVLAHRLADDTIARFPNHPGGYYASAVLYLVDEDASSAREALDHSLTIDPTDARALAMRALVNGGLGDCDASRRDFERARSLRMPFSADDERAVRDCTPR
jgi:tetratricopeptide (TPR) repeat protein